MKNNFIITNLNIEEIDNKVSKIILEPLEKGFGHTIGNSIRRILLSSIPGYAITELEIDGIFHEFSGKDGIKEDIINILLNIKELSIKLIDDEEAILEIETSEIGEVKAKHIFSKNRFKIFNENNLICTITKKNTNLKIKMLVKKGIGYISSSDINFNYKNINNKYLNSQKLFIDAIFNPIENVSYLVEPTRYEKYTDLDKLIINISTNGAITGKESIIIASKILIDKISIFLSLNEKDTSINKEEKINIKKDLNPILLKTIENLDLTVRSYNCLKSESIVYIGDLIQKTELDLLKISNFGKKSLLEIKEILLLNNLFLGTKIENWNKIKN